MTPAGRVMATRWAWLYTATEMVLAPVQLTVVIIGLHLTSGLH